MFSFIHHIFESASDSSYLTVLACRSYYPCTELIHIITWLHYNFISLLIQSEEIGNQRLCQIRRRLIYIFRYYDKHAQIQVIHHRISLISNLNFFFTVASPALNTIRNLWYDSVFNSCIISLSIISYVNMSIWYELTFEHPIICHIYFVPIFNNIHLISNR